LHDAKGASNYPGSEEPATGTYAHARLFPSAGRIERKRKKNEKGLLPEFDRRYIAIIFAARKGAVDGARRGRARASLEQCYNLYRNV